MYHLKIYNYFRKVMKKLGFILKYVYIFEIIAKKVKAQFAVLLKKLQIG